MKIRNIIMNRKGSTLALTIIIFAVLMIFATFTLGFMVTENKQAMYHQNKAQAYYIARSGADIADAAIRKQLRQIFNNGDQADVNEYIEDLHDLDLSIKNSDIAENLGADELLIKSSIIEVNGKNVLAIDVDAKYNGVAQSLRKIVTSGLAISSGTENTFDYEGLPIVAISGAWRSDKDKGSDLSNPSLNNNVKYAEIVGENSMFNQFDFPTKSWDSEDLDGAITLSEIIYDETAETPSIINYYNTSVTISGDLNIDSRIKELNFHGDLIINGSISINDSVIFNVKDSLSVSGVDSINSEGDPLDCKFFIYNINGELDAFTMDLSDNLNGEVFADFHVKDGRSTVDLKKSYWEGDLTSNAIFSGTLKDGGTSSDSQIPSSQFDYDVMISSDDSSNKINFNGSIWAPNAYVVVGGSVVASSKNAILQDGMLLGKFVEIEGNNHTKNFDFLNTLLSNSQDGTRIPVEIETEADIRALTFNSYYTEQ